MPVIVITASNTNSFVMLLENNSDNEFVKAVDSMLEHLLNSQDLHGKLLCNLVPFFPGAMKLLSTNRE